MQVIPYEEKYKDIVRDICIQTGSKDNLVNKEHHDFTLLMYCDPYLEHGKCFLLMDENEEVQGYILCAPEYREYREYIKEYVLRIMKDAPSFISRCDTSGYAQYQDTYPAHLHIDIMESCTGKGNGTLLMKTLLEALRREHVKGIMVGVAKDNERAFSFYKKMGFKVIEESQYGYTMGQSLEGEL